MSIAAIIVNYRTPAECMDAVHGVLKELEAFAGAHVYVVDNDSRDGSFDVLSAQQQDDAWRERVTVIAAERNGGYGYGINVGIRAALAPTAHAIPDYLYVLNPDAVPDPGVLHNQRAYLDAHGDVGVTGCVVHAPDGELQGAAFRFPSVWSELEGAAGLGVISKLLKRHVVALKVPEQTTEVDWVPGTSMLIRRAVIEQIGGFDEGFFLYFEEADYCRRVRDAGWKVAFVPGAGVSHVGSVATGMSDTTRRMPDYWFESRHRYFVKHHGVAYAAMCDAAFVLGRGVFRLKQSAKGQKPQGRPEFDRDFIRHSARMLVEPPDLNGHATSDGNGAHPADATAALATVPLLLEDLATYQWQLTEPGLWAVLAHRLGARAQRAEPGVTHTAMSASHRALATAVDWIWGIEIPVDVQLGRRVRLWHNGCMQLHAKSIGNDVQIRHDTTLGTVRASDDNTDHLPVIEDRVELGAGVSVLGGVRVGHDAFVGANSLVLKDVPPSSTVVGVPARIVPT